VTAPGPKQIRWLPFMLKHLEPHPWECWAVEDRRVEGGFKFGCHLHGVEGQHRPWPWLMKLLKRL
jgi:hypothetical protein